MKLNNIFKKRLQCILVVNKDYLTFYLEKSKLPYTLKLPEYVVSEMEILDVAEYMNLLKKFVTENNLLNCRFTILLSNEVLFTKKLPFAPNFDYKNNLETFLDKVPFETSKLTGKYFIWDKEVVFIAVNKNLYTKLLEVLTLQNNSLNGVYPYLICNEKNVELVDIKNLFTNSDLAKKLNFVVD